MGMKCPYCQFESNEKETCPNCLKKMKKGQIGYLMAAIPKLRLPKFNLRLKADESTKKLSYLLGKGKLIAKEKLTELGSWIIQELTQEIDKFLQHEQDPLIQEVLKLFRYRLRSNPSEIEIAEIQEYIDVLPERLKQDKCLVCFQPLSGKILVCPECKRGFKAVESFLPNCCQM